ncbi:MAG: T9SS type A sorting domain-containing protein [Cytophagales bacterium]|nr:T9SS type A sorting domain-containing protein [Cytophagales bacterium]
MLKTLLLVLSASLTLSCAWGQDKIVKVYYPDSLDFYVIEMEENQDLATRSPQWKLDSQEVGFSGQGYLVWTGGQEGQITKKPYANEPENERLTYTIYVERSGVYYVKIRNYHYYEDAGPLGGNDFWASANGAEWIKIFDHDPLKWTWDEGTVWPNYTLNQGLNKIEVGSRSKGIALDRMVIFHEDHIPEGWIKGSEWHTKPRNWKKLDSTNWFLDTVLTETPSKLVDDQTAPSQPLFDSSAFTLKKNQIVARWSPSGDDFKLAGYQLWLDGNLITPNPVLGATHSSSGLEPNTEYHWVVRALDWMGNASGGDTLVVKTLPDPDAGLTDAANGLAEVPLPHPNPFTEELRLSNGSGTWEKVAVYNMIGVKVMESGISPDHTTVLDARTWPAGTYLLQLYGGQGTVYHRISKLR